MNNSNSSNSQCKVLVLTKVVPATVGSIHKYTYIILLTFIK